MSKEETSVEFEVYGKYAMFSDPVTRSGGEKSSYHIPTGGALKGITKNIYWKPSIIWILDAVRIMNTVQTEARGVRIPFWNGGCSLFNYTYLKDVRYQVRAHFVFNPNYPQFRDDWIVDRHMEMLQKALKAGGNRTVFLGTRDCKAYVKPCVFGEGKGSYDDMDGETDYGFMYYSFTYPEEAMLPEEKGKLTANFWHPVMQKGGLINLPLPSECKERRIIKDYPMTEFQQKDIQKTRRKNRCRNRCRKITEGRA